MNSGNLRMVQVKDFPFVMASTCVLFDKDLSTQAKLSWIFMFNICHNEELRKQFHFSPKTLQNPLGVKERMCERYLNELIHFGYVERIDTYNTIKDNLTGKTKYIKECEYVLSPYRDNSIEKAKEIIRSAFNNTTMVGMWFDLIDRQKDTSKQIPIEAVIAENEQAKRNTPKPSKPSSGNTFARYDGYIKETTIAHKDSNNIVDSNVVVDSIATEEKVTKVIEIKTYTKNEYINIVDCGDRQVYQCFAENGYLAEYTKGFWQQLQFFTLATMVKQVRHRKINKAEVMAIVLFQKGLEENGFKDYKKIAILKRNPDIESDLIGFVDRTISNPLMQELIDIKKLNWSD